MDPDVVLFVNFISALTIESAKRRLHRRAGNLLVVPTSEPSDVRQSTPAVVHDFTAKNAQKGYYWGGLNRVRG